MLRPQVRRRGSIPSHQNRHPTSSAIPSQTQRVCVLQILMSNVLRRKRFRKRSRLDATHRVLRFRAEESSFEQEERTGRTLIPQNTRIYIFIYLESESERVHRFNQVCVPSGLYFNQDWRSVGEVARIFSLSVTQLSFKSKFITFQRTRHSTTHKRQE